MPKDIKLTNWQVPRDPKLAHFEALSAAPPIDMKNYENMGGLEHHDTVESVTEKMIAKQEMARGQKIDAEPLTSTVNLNGVVDDRKDRTFYAVKR